MEVIPGVNCLHFGCVKEQLRKAGEFLKGEDWIEVDVADGIFTFPKTWNSPTEWANLRLSYKLVVHLMVENPEKYVESWIAAGANRLIVHLEALNEESARRILERTRKRRVEVMLSSSPFTPISKLWPYLKFFSHFQVLAVDPGLSGQKFIPVVLQKIRFLRNFAPSAMIEVDGGINPETAELVKDAGANIVVSTSYIFNSKNPRKAFKELKKI